eukprot:CAMPEP_0197037184 /NCGR_PEP_ID=MMETSP1384-20130603/14457_1 /TAXON_ID=29189 /ORGANISM="Ammonia sp." /LENGTH=100 /DNA_ID=CAMNT_0042467449 /DNA_START=71 /DNA_END=373 /DNA_ORIENTATION=-
MSRATYRFSYSQSNIQVPVAGFVSNVPYEQPANWLAGSSVPIGAFVGDVVKVASTNTPPFSKLQLQPISQPKTLFHCDDKSDTPSIACCAVCCTEELSRL